MRKVLSREALGGRLLEEGSLKRGCLEGGYAFSNGWAERRSASWQILQISPGHISRTPGCLSDVPGYSRFSRTSPDAPGYSRTFPDIAGHVREISGRYPGDEIPKLIQSSPKIRPRNDKKPCKTTPPCWYICTAKRRVLHGQKTCSAAKNIQQEGPSKKATSLGGGSRFFQDRLSGGRFR